MVLPGTDFQLSTFGVGPKAGFSYISWAGPTWRHLFLPPGRTQGQVLLTLCAGQAHTQTLLALLPGRIPKSWFDFSARGQAPRTDFSCLVPETGPRELV